MKKRILALLLAIWMVVGLAACGTTEPSADPDSTPSAGSETAEIEERKLTMACAWPEASTFSLAINYFCDYVEEATGGKVTFDRFLGGTFCTAVEELEYVANGAIDVSMSIPEVKETIPLLFSAPYAANGMADSAEMCKYFYLENPETAAMIQAETDAMNVKILGLYCSSPNAFCATKSISSWEDLSTTLFGTGIFSGPFQNLGLNVQTVPATEQYESLSRGMTNASGGGLSVIHQNKWHEVCKYFLSMKCAAGNLPVWMNLDTWNSLSPALQEIMVEAANATSAYITEAHVAADQAAVDYFLSIGGEINEMSAEDEEAYLREVYLGNYHDYYPFAEGLGHGDYYDTITMAAIERLGLDITLDDLKAALD